MSDQVMGSSPRHSHEKLDVYQVALQFAVWRRRRLVIPRGNADLADQLTRAASSVVLNVAEGAGEFSLREKRRFYRLARRSATECAAALDLLEACGGLPASALEPGRALLDRTVAMLTKLVPRGEAPEELRRKRSRTNGA